MSIVPPPVPPPVPPMAPLPQQGSVTLDMKNIGRSVLMKAQQQTEKLKQLFKTKISLAIENDVQNSFKKQFISSYQDVSPILQDGPCCGVVALAMAAQMFDIDVSASSILKICRENKYSVQGELFSAYDMAELAREIPGCCATVLDMTEPDSKNKLLSDLASRIPVLVPYDADGNYGPCLKKGHKAHWVLLAGFLLSTDLDLTSDLQLIPDSDISILHHVTPETPSSSLTPLIQTSQDVFVYGLQGKSQHTGVMSLEQLLASNSNLLEVDPEREANKDMYHLPQEGIQRTLCNKVVVINLSR